MLLSDARFSAATRDCILAWDKVRPVPQVTIDFGNGKVLHRTLKGSTVIYLCRPDGRVVDAYPGVYTPQDFLPLLTQGRLHLSDEDASLQNWHQQAVSPPAMAAGPVTASKAALQSPILAALDHPPPAFPEEGLSDLSARPLSRAEVAGRVGLPPRASGSQMVAADSLRYKVLMRPEVHRRLGSRSPASPRDWMKTMFVEVLKVPIDDPYLGLKDEDLPGTPSVP